MATVSKQEMAKAYVAQVEAQLKQAQAQVDVLQKHLLECQTTLGEEDGADNE
tara:strand:+ start:259 stop:414 length:156 start_codon:yes stop_codon:yes gene_type:complete